MRPDWTKWTGLDSNLDLVTVSRYQPQSIYINYKNTENTNLKNVSNLFSKVELQHTFGQHNKKINYGSHFYTENCTVRLAFNYF
jgi:hypothetical protein